MHDSFPLFEVVGQSHLDSNIEDQEIVTNPPDICQVVEVTTESDEQPVSMSELYPLQISPVSSYAGERGGALVRCEGQGRAPVVGAPALPSKQPPLSPGIVLALTVSTGMPWAHLFSADRVSACLHLIVHTFPCMT